MVKDTQLENRVAHAHTEPSWAALLPPLHCRAVLTLVVCDLGGQKSATTYFPGTPTSYSIQKSSIFNDVQGGLMHLVNGKAYVQYPLFLDNLKLEKPQHTA